MPWSSASSLARRELHNEIIVDELTPEITDKMTHKMIEKMTADYLEDPLLVL